MERIKTLSDADLLLQFMKAYTAADKSGYTGSTRLAMACVYVAMGVRNYNDTRMDALNDARAVAGRVAQGLRQMYALMDNTMAPSDAFDKALAGALDQYVVHYLAGAQ